MPAGLQIINTHGTVLIDSSNPCLQLRAKYTISTNSATGPNSITEIVVPNAQRPVFALRPHANNVGMYILAVNLRPSERLVQVMRTNNVGTEAVGAVGATLYHFDVPTATSGTYGLQVFNEAGVCTFDSSGKTAVVVASASGPGVVDSPTPAPGRIFAFADPAPYRHRLIEFEDGQSEINVSANAGVLLNGGAIRMKPGMPVIYELVPGDVGETNTYYRGRPALMTIDVTGY